MMYSKNTIWKQGEDAAAAYLEKHGHRVLARNWRYSHIEIDIISIKGQELHIVEVKSREIPSSQAPESRVDAHKRKMMVSGARAFLKLNRESLPDDLEVIFDVISVLIDGEMFEIDYYPQAFIPLYA
ncbi:MAG TPA: endonuclease [Rikenellaceae bacterium]|nr:endonuclease [Rikenellaceae bacterium]HBH21100.1 endonuclease [Rikenellaceae bacterium]HCZ22219.1 endonuclease [Rikenellaceae bacterium]